MNLKEVYFQEKTRDLVQNFFQELLFFFANNWKLKAERKDLWKSETTNCSLNKEASKKTTADTKTREIYSFLMGFCNRTKAEDRLSGGTQYLGMKKKS